MMAFSWMNKNARNVTKSTDQSRLTNPRRSRGEASSGWSKGFSDGRGATATSTQNVGGGTKPPETMQAEPDLGTASTFAKPPMVGRTASPAPMKDIRRRMTARGRQPLASRAALPNFSIPTPPTSSAPGRAAGSTPTGADS